MYIKQNFENYPGINPQFNSLKVSNLYIKAVLRGKNSTAISLVAALGLSACGGGSTTDASTPNPSGPLEDTTGGSSTATDGDDASDNSGGAILGGGGGGGGGVSSSNNLTL